jgi:hypothetical protein
MNLRTRIAALESTFAPSNCLECEMRRLNQSQDQPVPTTPCNHPRKTLHEYIAEMANSGGSDAK